MFHMTPYQNEAPNLFRWFDELEKSFWNESSAGLRQFRTDIADDGDHYTLKAELPGFSKEEIHVDVDQDVLTISAKHADTKEENHDRYVRRECCCGAVMRRFGVADVNTEEIHAGYQDGVLTLNLPKQEPKKLPEAKQIAIQ